jgi:hypothetical protein
MGNRIFGALALASMAATASATLVWNNVMDMKDLGATHDGWTASRAKDQGFTSYRCAADDFQVRLQSRVTAIVFYSVPINDPIILGGDWYIFDGAKESGPPGDPIAGKFGQVLERKDTGIFNAALGGNVWENRIAMNVVLDPGRYFIGFRTFQSFVGGGGKNGILTTRFANGSARAHWSFDILEDGYATGPWMTMDVFNGVRDQEWAFKLEGEIVPEPATGLALGALAFGLRRKRR